jgi:hypothetical protein
MNDSLNLIKLEITYLDLFKILLGKKCFSKQSINRRLEQSIEKYGMRVLALKGSISTESYKEKISNLTMMTFLNIYINV